MWKSGFLEKIGVWEQMSLRRKHRKIFTAEAPQKFADKAPEIGPWIQTVRKIGRKMFFNILLCISRKTQETSAEEHVYLSCIM